RVGVAARSRVLAGEHERARVAGRRIAGARERRFGLGVLAGGVGLERELALVVRDARSERAAAALFELLGDLDRGAPVSRAFVQVEEGQSRLGVERRPGKRAVRFFGAIEEAGLQVVLREPV